MRITSDPFTHAETKIDLEKPADFEVKVQPNPGEEGVYTALPADLGDYGFRVALSVGRR